MNLTKINAAATMLQDKITVACGRSYEKGLKSFKSKYILDWQDFENQTVGFTSKHGNLPDLKFSYSFIKSEGKRTHHEVQVTNA